MVDPTKQNNDQDITDKVFKPVLERFKNILATPIAGENVYKDQILKHKAIKEYHKFLEEKGIIGTNIIPQYQVSQLSYDEYRKIAEKLRYGKPVSSEELRKIGQELVQNSVSPYTATCPAAQGEIEIIYGIQNFKYLNNNQPEITDLSKRIIPLGPLKGQLFKKISEPGKFPYGERRSKPDLDNPIHFEIKEDGTAKLPCSKGEEYYIKIDTLTSDDDIQQWLDGYQLMINELSEFLEYEWKTVHLPRWKANKDKGNNFWLGVNDGISEIPAIQQMDEQLFEYLNSSNAQAGIPPNPIREGMKYIIHSVTSIIQAIGNSLTKEQEKQYSFFLQDKIHMYILEIFILYWKELLSPADKAYFDGKELTEMFAAVIGFIIEFYLGGKAIDLLIKYSARMGFIVSSTFVEKDLIALANATSKLVLPQKMANGLAYRFAVWSLKRNININARIFNKINKTMANVDSIFMGQQTTYYIIREDVEAILSKTESIPVKNKAPTNATKETGDATKGETNLDPVSMLTGEELLTLVDDTLFSWNGNTF